MLISIIYVVNMDREVYLIYGNLQFLYLKLYQYNTYNE